MRIFTADLHIHIGRAGPGRPVKITAARDLTFANIARECAERKGIDIAGIVDCASPLVLGEIEQMIVQGEAQELPGGGLRYRGALTLLLASELEAVEANGRPAHYLSYFPNLESLREFSRRLAGLVTNLELSSQRCRLRGRELLRLTQAAGGVLLPSHAFTPHRSVYGSCAPRLEELFGEQLAEIPALELGLSADSYLADRIGETSRFTFLSNSDAHSLPKIAREYNLLELAEPTFAEVMMALQRRGGRRAVANYGLDPRLGKYHRTYCLDCRLVEVCAPPALACSQCGRSRVVEGVLDRIVEIQNFRQPRPPEHRPPYYYQVPLQFVPGVGPQALFKLLNRFGTEMEVLHRAPEDQLTQAVGSRVAESILLARRGELPLQAGGGGRYGRAIAHPRQAQLRLGMPME